MNLAQTLGLAAALIALGTWLTHRISLLSRLNIPPAVTAGLGYCFATTLLRQMTGVEWAIDLSVQGIWMGVLFSSIGLSASARTLKRGGISTVWLLALSTVFCVIQNTLGIGIAKFLGMHPLMGVMAGSVTLVGGPATGMAFAPLFEKAGLVSADLIAMTSATFGIVSGAILGGPLAAGLLRHRTKALQHRGQKSNQASDFATPDLTSSIVRGTPESTYLLLITVIGLGTWVSRLFEKSGLILPGYIGGMILAVLARGLDDLKPDHRSWIHLESAEKAGEFALSFFLVTALMNLKLWNLASLALPLTAILIVQVLAVLAFSAWVIDRLMGRNYESAVISAGFVGFALG
ncbi:MAG: sodium/glutamate symporter, partial [Bdellovibrionota bacterium]